MKNIFINRYNQLRSGWKIAIVYVSFYLTTNILGVIALLAYLASKMMANVGPITQSELMADATLRTILSYIQFTTVIFSVILFWKIFDKKRIRDLGLTNPIRHIKDLIMGLMLGAVSMGAVFAVLLLLGQIELINPLSQPNITKALAIDFVMFIFVAINEELFARGYCMTVLKQTNNTWVMVIVSAAIFSAMHLGNSHVKPLALINIFLVGILFAYMFLKTKNLWMPIGYHLTWNYFQGNIFGFPVSGMDVNGMYNLKLTSENIVNGAGFGPEGGLVVTAVIIIGLAFVWFMKNRENEEYMKM